ncbi:uncharacterized protein ARMOST_12186 [Armillaria ostoyae]|uniref:Uncharacterized protein n=1 Tax=Armillaria ostoyae TaxID=47428 RepID=A0A284RJA9_ARMOS|nr:uncharacterized protein ARMOST_12186 [Armillaria ostoyae]
MLPEPPVGVGLFDYGDDVPGCEGEVVWVRGAEVVCPECLAWTTAGAGGGREGDLKVDERTEAGAEVAWSTGLSVEQMGIFFRRPVLLMEKLGERTTRKRTIRKEDLGNVGIAGLIHAYMWFCAKTYSALAMPVTTDSGPSTLIVRGTLCRGKL